MTERKLKILVLGGYGTFGGRLVRLLADEERVSLLVAGRSHEKAEAFCRQHRGKAEMVAADFDRDGDVRMQLAMLAPEVVVDASGPFQAYGEDPYRVIKAAIAEKVHYLDLADGSDFVAGVSAFDDEAHAAGVFILTGMSSFPVLSAAVVRRLAVGVSRVEHIAAGIAPSPFAGVGRNVVRAIASYAGKPVKMRSDGIDTAGYALVETRRHAVAPPGAVPLHPRTFSLVDVPDLTTLPRQWPTAETVWMGAAPMPAVLHAALRGLARLVKLGLLPGLSPMADLMHRATGILRWGEHRGGMFVELGGSDGAGNRVMRSWHLVAEGDDGPFIPSLAADAVIRNLLGGRTPAAGARAGVSDVDLVDFERSFARLAIRTGVRRSEDEMPNLPLYQRLLVEALPRLPRPIAEMHHVEFPREATGVADIERGRGPVAALVGMLLKLPPSGKAVPLRVRFTPEKGGERWRREFGGHVFESFQEAGHERFEGLLVEHLGPVACGMAAVVEDGKLRLVVRRCTVCGIPVPAWLMPRGDVHESAEDGRFNFHVEAALPGLGSIIRYKGWLAPSA